MKTALEYYKGFIDDLATSWPIHSVLARWVREWGTAEPKTYETQNEFNDLMAHFTPEQREMIADLVQQAYEDGIFKVLAYLRDEINLEGLRISHNSMEFPVEPFGMTPYEDWISRKAGDLWPEDTDSGDK
jgi:hypothetical protein